MARVQVDTGLAHLDRPFEYSVPESMAETAVPGVRVKVRFAGQDLDGFVLERVGVAEHEGRLAPLRKVVSPEPVLTLTVLAAARDVADATGGTLGDVLRLAIPPRHAAAERALPMTPAERGAETGSVAADGTALAAESPWYRYAAGPAFLRHLTSGARPGAAVLALPAVVPATDWPALFVDAVAATIAGGRSALVIVPDRRDVDRLEAALRPVVGAARMTRLSADQGPQARYTAYLKVLRGHVDVVVGTRAAAWAPLSRLGLLAWWDDGDDLHDEPRSPHAPVREVLRARATREGAALLTAGFARSVAVQSWVEEGVLASLTADRGVARAVLPRVRVAGEGHDRDRDPAVAAAHLPTVAWRAAKDALTHGPVLIQVPRRGYLPSLACAQCRDRARCVHCAGPLGLSGPDGPPTCRWCGRVEGAFRCPECEGRQLRSSIIGARRTAEELGRAFPGVPVDRSGADTVLSTVSDTPRLVVSTPGAEPVAEGGYAAVLLLDGWALLDRPGLLSGEEALRRWMGASALVRPGASVVLCGVPTHASLAPVEALVRWDPVWFAQRELEERTALSLPPTVGLATISGARPSVTRLLSDLRLPEAAVVLGPIPSGQGEEVRAVVRVPRGEARSLARELAAGRALSAARKDPAPARVHMGVADPTA